MPVDREKTPAATPSSGGEVPTREPAPAPPIPAELLQNAIESAGVGLAILDERGCFLHVNSQFEQVLGYGPGELRGRSGELLCSTKDWEAVMTQSAKWARGEPTSPGEWQLQTPEGRPIRARVGVKPYVDPLGRRLDLVWLVDCTEQWEAQTARNCKELERLVEERTAKLQETIADVEAFSYSVSHDLRAPLRTMQQYAQIVCDDFAAQLPPEARHHLRRIVLACDRLDDLIQDVLTYSRLSREEIDLAPVNLEKLLRQILEQNPGFKPPCAAVEIRSRLEPVTGHEAFLTQCLSNLLANAVKFVAPGVLPRIEIWTEPRGGQVRLWVKDNGIGIAPADQKRVFGLFERVHGASEYEGTGLGLSIVRKAVERMGGQAGVESELGKGSRFWIQLKKGNTQ